MPSSVVVFTVAVGMVAEGLVKAFELGNVVEQGVRNVGAGGISSRRPIESVGRRTHSGIVSPSLIISSIFGYFTRGRSSCHHTLLVKKGCLEYVFIVIFHNVVL